MTSRSVDRTPEAQVCVVIHPELPGDKHARDADARLAEAVGLALALDLQVKAAEIARVRKTVPATLFGSGKVEEIAALIRAQRTETCNANIEKEGLKNELDKAKGQFNVMVEINDLRRSVSEFQMATLQVAQDRIEELEEFVSALACQHDFELGQAQMIVREFVNQNLAKARELVGDKRE